MSSVPTTSSETEPPAYVGVTRNDSDGEMSPLNGAMKKQAPIPSIPAASPLNVSSLLTPFVVIQVAAADEGASGIP